MKLIYRAIEFDYQPREGNTGKPTPAPQPQPYTLIYRGESYTIDPNAPTQAPIIDRSYDLIYRGVTLQVIPA